MPNLKQLSPGKPAKSRRLDDDGMEVEIPEDVDETHGLAPPPAPLRESGSGASSADAGGSGASTGQHEDSTKATSALTLESIGKLLDEKLSISEKKVENQIDTKLTPINDMFKKVLGDLADFKKFVRGELDDVGMKFSSMKNELDSSASKLVKLEAEIKVLKSNATVKTNVGTISSNDERARTIVIGKIPNATTEDVAKQFVLKHCADASLSPPIHIFPKGEFKGTVIFAKFRR